MKNDKIYLDEYGSPIGKLYIVSLDSGLLMISFSSSEAKSFIKKKYSGYSVAEKNKINKTVIKYLDSYFKKKNVDVEIPMFLCGTEFQNKVWQELKEIPYGQTISYKELSKRVGINKGFQAVGQANSKNPFPVLIPCHRVITSDGKLGGYSGGINKKKYLLELEGVKI